jgi:8-oxo-dGTP pyrophosphatase MutT (NUDIX family)
VKFDPPALERLRRILQSRPAAEIEPGQNRRACVLAPLICDKDEWSLLFHRRAETLSAHSGQIAFPGGVVEEGESLEDAALRETEEEIGVPAGSVELIGRLDDLITVSGFLVAPFVGVITKEKEYVLQKSEVVEIFEVPLRKLLEPGNPSVRYVEFRRQAYPSYFYDGGIVEIWGLTGRMVKELLDLIRLL